MEELIARYAKVPVKQRLLGFGGIVLVVLALYWQWIYADQSARLDALEQSYAQLEEERAQKQAYIDNLAKYEARLEELQASLNTARAQLPDDPDVPELLAQLGNKARQAGLSIEKFEPREEKAQEFYGEIAFAMQVQGSFHEVGTFVDSLAKLDRILNVTGISMTSPRTENQKVVLAGSFTIKTYRFLESAPPGGKK